MERREEEFRKILSMVFDDYIDSILTALEEDKNTEKIFPYTLACINFINELRTKNIKVELSDVFIDTIIDRIFREVSNYIGR